RLFNRRTATHHILNHGYPQIQNSTQNATVVLERTKAGDLYKLRKQTIEPVFGIIKSIMGFRRFRLRGLAYNCGRMARLQVA
ncbi:transposase, partial [Acetobacter oeni]